MAYRRRKFGRSRTFRKRPTLRRKVAKLTRRVAQQRQELKYFDVDASGAISTTATITSLTSIPSGSTVITREGIKIAVESVHWRGFVINADNYNHCRMFIGYDKQSTSAIPAATDVFDVTAANFGYVDALRTFNRKQRIKRVMDKHLVSKFYIAATATDIRVFAGVKRFKKPVIVSYNNANTEPAQTNNFFSFAVSDSAITSHPTLYWNIRVFYRDI